MCGLNYQCTRTSYRSRETVTVKQVAKKSHGEVLGWLQARMHIILYICYPAGGQQTDVSVAQD